MPFEWPDERLSLLRTTSETAAEGLNRQSRLDSSWLTAGRFAFLLALLLFLSFPSVLLGTQTFVFRDYGLFSYPVAFFQRECFWHGQLPLWNPYSQCGLPFLAQWNTMCLYPPALLYLLLPLTWGLSFFCLAHLFWAGLGMFVLTRCWTQNALAAAVAGIIFAFNGLTLNLLIWPSHIATFSWLPWVVWLVPQAWQQGGRMLPWAVGAGVFQMLGGGPEEILLTWILLSVLACTDLFQMTGQKTRLALRLGSIILLIALLCAVQLLPFLQLLSHSQRNSAYGESSHDWSMPFWGWANFLVPLYRTYLTPQGVYLQTGQYWTSSYYAGIGTIFLAAIALNRRRDLRTLALSILVFLCLVLAWGDTSVLFTTLKRVAPSLGMMRYSIKFVILPVALLPILAAFGLKGWLEKSPKIKYFDWVLLVGLVSVAALVVLSEWHGPADSWKTTLKSGLSRAGFLVAIFFLLRLLKERTPGNRLSQLIPWIFLSVFWLDLKTHTPDQNPTASPQIYAPGFLNARANWNPAPSLGLSRAMVGPAARYQLDHTWVANIKENFLRFRLADRSNCNLIDRIPQIDSFFSLVPKEADEVNTLLYGNKHQNPQALMDFMAISQVTAPSSLTEWSPRTNAMPWVTIGQEPLFQDTLSALTNDAVDFRKVVFLPHEARAELKAKASDSASVTIQQLSSNKIIAETHADQPCMVVISQAFYPCWRASVDGRPTKLFRANYAFQAFEVPAGRHLLKITYQNRLFYFGFLISIAGLFAWAFIWYRSIYSNPCASPATRLE